MDAGTIGGWMLAAVWVAVASWVVVDMWCRGYRLASAIMVVGCIGAGLMAYGEYTAKAVQ